jgi:DUF971 family protein
MLLKWNTGERAEIPYEELRFQCPCAGCVNELTGERMIRREDVLAGVKPLQVELVGRYALRIQWSDGHQAGMFSFERLWELGQDKSAQS